MSMCITTNQNRYGINKMDKLTKHVDRNGYVSRFNADEMTINTIIKISTY